MILDRKHNYDVETKEDNKNLNNYNKIFQKAKKVINLKIRIENINVYLLNNINNIVNVYVL